MYGRKLNGEVLEFGHEGILYRNSFIMYDRGSKSLWVHVSGEAIKGDRKGQKLEFLPSEITTWGDWSRRHPMGTALVGDKAEGFMGTFTLRQRVRAFGLSIGQGRQVKLVRFTLLQRVPVLEVEVEGQPVVAVYDPDAVRGFAFASRLGKQRLHFSAVAPLAAEGGEHGAEGAGDGHSSGPALMRDSETGSLWERMSGRCLAGELAGQQLDPVPATAWLGQRWRGFFPKGEVLGLPEAPNREKSESHQGGSGEHGG